MSGVPPGVRKAARNAEPWWWAQAMTALRWFALMGRPFTAADLRAYMAGVDPDSPVRWGALFAAAQARGLIEVCGYELDKRTGRPGRVWRGVPDEGSP